MHVLILNQTFHPDTAATAQHMWDLVRDLDQRGHRVSIITSRIAYGSDEILGPAFERTWQAIEIHRVAGTRFGKKSRLGLLGRLSDFASFYVAAGVKLFRLPTPDVVLALTSPPMISTLAVGLKWFARNLRGRSPRLVYYVMDLYPDAAVASGVMRPGGVMERLLSRLTARTLAASDAVISLGRDMTARMIERFGTSADPRRIHRVTPWADEGELFPVAKADNRLVRELGLADVFTIVYSGNLGLPHDLETLVEAIDATRDQADLRWLFIGGGRRMDELKRLAADRAWPHVQILPYQRREDLNLSLNLADVHLISQLPAFTGVVVPSKLFGILAVGKPSLMIGPADAEVSRILTEREAGLVISNGDAAALTQALLTLRDDPALRSRLGANARAALEAQYACRLACQRIEAILRGETVERPTP